MFDARVQDVLHVRTPRVRKNRAVTQRARSPLMRPWNQPTTLPAANIRSLFEQRLAIVMDVGDPACVEDGAQLASPIIRAPGTRRA